MRVQRAHQTILCPTGQGAWSWGEHITMLGQMRSFPEVSRKKQSFPTLFGRIVQDRPKTVIHKLNARYNVQVKRLKHLLTRAHHPSD